MDWQNHLEKIPIQKIEKSRKNQSEIAAGEQKTTSEKANFCSNTVFSFYFKFRAKKFHAAKPLAFSLHFLFGRDQNHYSNLTSKIMKMCEQIFLSSKKYHFNGTSTNPVHDSVLNMWHCDIMSLPPTNSHNIFNGQKKNWYKKSRNRPTGLNLLIKLCSR